MRRSTHIRGSLLALAAVLTGCSGSPSADPRSEDANPASPPDGSARPAANGPSEPTTSLPVGTGDPLDEDAPRLHIDDVGIRLARERAPLVRLVGGAFGTREPDAHELPALYDALAEQAEHDKGAAARAGEAWSSTLVLFAGPGTHQRVLSDSIYNASLAGYTRFGIAVHDPSHDARRMLVVEPPTLVLERPAGDGDALDDDPTEDPRGITVALDDGGYSVGRGAEGPAPTRATDQALVEIGRQTDRLTGLDPNARMLVISASDHTPLQRLVDAMVVARKHGLTDLRLSGANAHDHRFDVRRALAADAIGLGDLQDSGGSLGLEAFGNLEGFGHGSGSGSGIGLGNVTRVPSGPPDDAPKILLETPKVLGSLDEGVIRRIVRAHKNELRFCYEKELRTQPALSGSLTVEFVVTADGTVPSAKVKTSTLSPAVDACVMRAIQRWKFPQPRNGVVQVRYPISMRPPS